MLSNQYKLCACFCGPSKEGKIVHFNEPVNPHSVIEFYPCAVEMEEFGRTMPGIKFQRSSTGKKESQFATPIFYTTWVYYCEEERDLDMKRLENGGI